MKKPASIISFYDFFDDALLRMYTRLNVAEWSAPRLNPILRGNYLMNISRVLVCASVVTQSLI